MGEYLLALYTGSLFLLVTVVSPSLLRTDKNKDIAGHFYGKILWRFYYISLFLLFLYTLLKDFWSGIILITGLGVNVGISGFLKKFKRRLGSVENLGYDHPERVRFRRISYLSLTVLWLNFLVASMVLITNLRGG